MAKSTDLKRHKQLGMPHGTAAARLRLMIMFDLVKQAGRDSCFKCGEKIETPETFSIEHKIDWLDGDENLFWDLGNIAFSHRKCNKPKYKVPANKKVGPDGTAWCSWHQDFLSVDAFYLVKNKLGNRTTYWICKECNRFKRAQEYKAKTS